MRSTILAALGAVLLAVPVAVMVQGQAAKQGAQSATQGPQPNRLAARQQGLFPPNQPVPR
ncbi:MAG TPA: hypothetical protein VFA03_16815 [Acetobacteraceae bacterium]|nr:hypothetical protein [Acetobacteraceae bacterium]